MKTKRYLIARIDKNGEARAVPHIFKKDPPYYYGRFVANVVCSFLNVTKGEVHGVFEVMYDPND